MRYRLFLNLSLFFYCVSSWSATLEDNIIYCNDCHGENGVSEESDVPTIAGLSAATITDMLFAYVDETRLAKKSKFRFGDTARAETDMTVTAKKLSEDDIGALAEHYSEQPFVAASQDYDTDKATRGLRVHEERCTKCHDEGGSLADDDAAILAGQWTPYLRQAFDDYLDGSRETDKKMLKALKKLSPSQIDDLLNYYASQQGG